MLPLIIPIGALLLGVSLLLLGNGLLNTLLAVRGSMEGYSDSLMGFIMSAYFVGFFIGTFLAIPLINRIGYIRTFAFCASLISCSALLHVLFINPYFWMFLRVMAGVLLVVLYTVVESWLTAHTPTQQRGRVFAVYMIVNLGALTIAQQLLRLDSPLSFVLFAIAAILVSAGLAPVTLTRLTQPVITNVERLKFKTLYSLAPVAVVGTFFSGLAMGAFWGMAPIYGIHVGLKVNGVATFMSCAILGGALCQYPMGRYSDKHDRRIVLAFISFFASLAALLLSFSAYIDVLLLLTIAIYGGLAFSVYPVAISHLVDQLEPEDNLAGVSGLLLLYGVGAAVGPAIAGQLMYYFGHQALPVYFFLTQMILAAYIVRIYKSHKEEQPEHASPFVPMVRTSPSVLDMLPDEDIKSSEN
ncbi:MAG: MFS transporter [Proteobacteria bacterium]|nr:MFS transporter [Pseudomonadota bacterium]NOG59477.1 MFS transporter [Pseudomonadota bacterium]